MRREGNEMLIIGISRQGTNQRRLRKSRQEERWSDGLSW